MQNSAMGADSFSAIVEVAIKVAQMHDSTVALTDLTELMPAGMTSVEVAEALEFTPELSTKYVLKDGLVLPKSGIRPDSDDHSRRLAHSMTNINVAKRISTMLGTDEAEMIAVTGSTSYRAASWRDDVDLFCVTRPQRMWLFLAKALLFARASRLLLRSKVPICLSCVVDETHAQDLFNNDRGALFARDALLARVLTGDGQYRSLLESAQWIRNYFPRLYDARCTPGGQSPATGVRSSAWDRFVNLFLFTTLGTYVRAKSRLHNRLLAMEGKGMALFHAKVGTDHLIYESARYGRLKEIYGAIKPMSEPVQSATR